MIVILYRTLPDETGSEENNYVKIYPLPHPFFSYKKIYFLSLGFHARDYVVGWSVIEINFLQKVIICKNNYLKINYLYKKPLVIMMKKEITNI